MEPIRKELLPGVYLTYIGTQKFKTGTISLQLILPLEEQTAALGALLPAVLRRGTMQHPDMRAISSALDQLYGADLAYTVRKKGENQCFGFASGFVDERFIPNGEHLLEPVADLLGEVLLDPLTKGGHFLHSYVESEKRNLIDAIESALNDKRDYADLRLLQEMCRGERYGIDRLGTIGSVQRIDGQTLYDFYRRALAEARIELFYCGSAAQRRVEDALLRALSALPRGSVTEPVAAVFVPARAEVQSITERMAVTQGKLSLGFRSDCRDHAALLMANLIFGGYSNSKLFLNVREKLSLCYYASSSYHRAKGIITVSSGIECKNLEIAKSEILRQLSAVQNGEFEPWEIDSAREIVIASIRQREDSAGRMEEFFLGQSATGIYESGEELIAALRGVTAERISEAARTVKPDTVYFLCGREDCTQ